jgi:membrane-associated phospholipid phosphatase
MRLKTKGAVRLALGLFLTTAVAGRADDVTEWNQMLLRSAIMTNPAVNPVVTSRIAAIYSAAVFDAVNGIDRRYEPIHVTPAAPAGASRRAAAVQAAYASLLQLQPVATYPSMKLALDSKRAASLARIATSQHEDPAGIAAGIAWGQTVADAIVAWRSTDGFTPPPPPFLGGIGVGQWRPTPPALAPGAVPQFASMTPWALASPAQFHPAGPPALDSARYAADFNEVKTMGRATSTLRTADQTVAAWFWNSATPSYLWNGVAVALLEEDRHHPHRRSLVRSARVLALLNLAIADAAIAGWEAKYSFQFWRPVTAIPLADADGNAATEADATWSPLFATPAHPEYPSGHSTLSGAGAAVLAELFGSRTRFTLDSDLIPGLTRSYHGFARALEDVKEARIFAGIHFRSACDDGQTIGEAVAKEVLRQVARPQHDRD